MTFETLKIPVEQKRPRLYDGQQLKRTEKQLNHRDTKHYRKNAAPSPDFSYKKLLTNINSLTIVSREKTENNGAVGYVGNSLTVHNPLFFCVQIVSE